MDSSLADANFGSLHTTHKLWEILEIIEKQEIQ